MAGEMFYLADTPLGQAIRDDDLTTFKVLLKSGENPFIKDRKGNTYLHYISTMHRPNVFHSLVSTGIDINAQNKHGNSALHVCALQKECGHVMDLMACSIDPFMVNWIGARADQLPETNQYWRTLHSFYMPGIFHTIKDNDSEKLEFLITNWCRIDIPRNGLIPRQFAASLGLHGLVTQLDRRRTSLDLIRGIQEDDWSLISTAASRYSCNFNMMRVTHLRSHPLQLAMYRGNMAYVEAMCKQVLPEMVMADVNSRVHIQGYFLGPLFFESLTLPPLDNPDINTAILHCLLSNAAKLNLRDEFGRNFLHLALDRPPNLPAIIAATSADIRPLILHQGARHSDRDFRGLTVRNLAEFLDRRDLVEWVDRSLVSCYRSQDIGELVDLALAGYQDFYFELDLRDTQIYAATSEEEEEEGKVIPFLDWFNRSLAAMQELWRQITLGKNPEDHLRELLVSTENMKECVDVSHVETFTLWQDKGGRCLLHLAILHHRPQLAEYLATLPTIDRQLQVLDCRLRTPLHYIYAVEPDSALVTLQNQLMYVATETVAKQRDVLGKSPADYAADETLSFFTEEKCVLYGLDRELEMLRSYRRLSEVICRHGSCFGLTRKERKAEMLRVVHEVDCSVDTMQKRLNPKAIPQCKPFPDLGQLCLERRDWSALRILATLGLNVDKVVTLIGQDKQPMHSSIRSHCIHLGKESMSHFFDRLTKGNFCELSSH